MINALCFDCCNMERSSKDTRGQAKGPSRETRKRVITAGFTIDLHGFTPTCMVSKLAGRNMAQE